MIAEARPIVGKLGLSVLIYHLPEYSVFVSDPVTAKRQSERRRRVHIASGKSAESAVSEPGIVKFAEFRKIAAVLLYDAAYFIVYSERLKIILGHAPE